VERDQQKKNQVKKKINKVQGLYAEKQKMG
jgi:hypothetical protein